MNPKQWAVLVWFYYCEQRPSPVFLGWRWPRLVWWTLVMACRPADLAVWCRLRLDMLHIMKCMTGKVDL